GYPRLLDLLDRAHVSATFFVEGWNGQHQPDRVAELVERGHEVGLHGWDHEAWHQLERDEAAERLVRGRDALVDAGATPVGFRSPGGERGPHTAGLLAEAGFRYDASLGNGRRPAVLPEGLAQVPFVWGHVDGTHYLPQPPADPADVAARWLITLDRAA